MRNINKLFHWFFFNVVFAMLPLMIRAVIASFMSGAELNLTDYINEFLFFCIVISSTTLGELFNLKKTLTENFFINVSFTGFIILIIISAILYGITIFNDIIVTQEIYEGFSNMINHEFLTRLTIIMAIFGFIMSLISQIHLLVEEKQI